MKKLNLALVLILSIFLLQSCQKDDQITPVDPDPQGKKAPELPKVESFVMPFSAFSEAEENDSRASSNWVYAASNVAIWNIILTYNLAIPVASFYESFNHDAVYQGSGIWLWAYDVEDNGTTYHAELYAELLVNNEIKWDMYVSEEGGFQEVHWYTGITAIGGEYASWTLNHDPYNPTPCLAIEYLENDGNGFETIRYTNIIPNVPENGGYIEYKEADDNNVDFNRIYDVYKSEIDNLLEINWNHPTHEGRVKDAEYFQDDEWHCWGYNLQNTDC